MAVDDPTKNAGLSSSVGSWLVLALAIVTGYAAWQILPLEGRIDSLERQNLASRDRMLAQIERLNAEVAILRGAPAAEKPASAPATGPSPAAPTPAAPANAAASAPPASAPEAKRAPPVDPIAYADAHLLPGDAAIVRAMLNGMPPPDIARDTQHSPAFVLARGAQIEKMLSAAPGAPRELVRALQDYLRNHRL
jgi:hypothetical protein